ncbi:MAG: class II glutamine amidotransferase, partial [Saccharolobus sp.]
YYYNKNRLDRESKEEYYKLYTDNNGYIFSSTVKYYLNINSEELTFGSITHL